MKLKQFEHQSFLTIVKENGLNESSFSFSKKRGLVYIHRTGEDTPFTFHRKKETKLNEQKKWKDSETYFLNLPSKGTPSMSWEEVLRKFKEWLKD